MKPLLIVVSLILNAAFIGTAAVRPSLAPPPLRDFFSRHFSSDNSGAPSVAISKPPAAHVAPAARPLWSTIASGDPAALIARLRAAGFPASIIRDLVSSEINRRYTDRMRALTEPDPNTPYWKASSSFSSLNPARMEEYYQNMRERSRVLRDLFKDDFFATGEVSAGQRRQYGDLPRAKIDAIQRIEDDYAEMSATVSAAMKGVMLPEDREKLALLAREKKADLAAILSPTELDDYTMRSSPITSLLRSQLGGFDPSLTEYRAIFQMQQSLNDQFPTNINGGMVSSLDSSSRQAAQKQLDEQLKASMGDARYADFIRETSREFQQLTQLAKRDNLPPAATLQAFNLRDTVAQESNRIFDDTSLDAAQKRAALQTLAQNTRTQLLASLGPTSGPAYVRVADQWLTNVERGSAVSFNNNASTGISIISGGSGGIATMISLGGAVPSYRRLPNPPPPQPNP